MINKEDPQTRLPIDAHSSRCSRRHTPSWRRGLASTANGKATATGPYTGDWRTCPSAHDAQWKYLQTPPPKNVSEAMSNFGSDPPKLPVDLNKECLRAVLKASGVGWVHRAATREEPPPARVHSSKRVGNPGSYTYSSFELPPKNPVRGYPNPDMSIRPTSNLHKLLGE